MKTFAALFAGFSLVLVAGCAADPADDAGSANADLVAPAPIATGTFELFRAPHYAPQSSCDRYTKLDVKDQSAHMEDAFVGTCMTFAAVDPNVRDYHLTRTGNSCGSSIYTASIEKGAEKWSIKLTDHRTRVCRDLVPALIIVEETHDGPNGPVTSTLYSNDRQPEATVEGTLHHVMGIGGETTGFAVFTDNGSYELILDPAEHDEFVEGKRARVKGTKTTLSGVETHDRPAIDVHDMLVCPDAGWIDCMPGGEVSSYCKADNRSWIESNCEGVGFAD